MVKGKEMTKAEMATFDQYLEIGQQIKDGRIDFDTAQAIIDHRWHVLNDQKERVISTKPFVELLITAQVHRLVTVRDKKTGSTRPMRAAEYRKLWPKVVSQPKQYEGRLDYILLVDRAPETVKLARRGKIQDPLDVRKLSDRISVPHGLNGKPLTRYIAFIHLGKKTVGKGAIERDGDELGLTSREGIYLVLQHKKHLFQHRLSFPGSRFDHRYIPNCTVLSDGQVDQGISFSRLCQKDITPISRGAIVIPVD